MAKPVVITDLEKAYYQIDDLEDCMYYHRDERNKVTIVYDRLLGYVGGRNEKKKKS